MLTLSPSSYFRQNVSFGLLYVFECPHWETYFLMSVEQYFVRTSAPFIIVSKLLSHYSHLLLTREKGRGWGVFGCSSFFCPCHCQHSRAGCLFHCVQFAVISVTYIYRQGSTIYLMWHFNWPFRGCIHNSIWHPPVDPTNLETIEFYTYIFTNLPISCLLGTHFKRRWFPFAVLM